LLLSLGLKFDPSVRVYTSVADPVPNPTRKVRIRPDPEHWFIHKDIKLNAVDAPMCRLGSSEENCQRHYLSDSRVRLRSRLQVTGELT
jgi:hypothetical protein